jgi:hypothetical protein
MKRTVFIAGCAIALASQADALVTNTQPYAMTYAEFQAVSDIASWTLPVDQLERRGRGRDDAPGDDHGNHGAGHASADPLIMQPFELSRRGRGRDDAPGDDHGNHGAGHA